ncbi:hypothetical protein Micbo1qcDRAFT_225287 [Microdochium bolleyi]|uniref:Uncharacterized protein n=1 Tax=Microdochium bolleyi TaxID=196109 RepID=A0A136J2P0_9PEZI|nr:hypothetical protein Micbo1qcDRAFT_225287 [Microdochium bolleyi]
MSAKHTKNNKKQGQASKSVQVPRQHWSQDPASLPQADGYHYTVDDYLSHQAHGGPYNNIASVGGAEYGMALYTGSDDGQSSVFPMQGSADEMQYDGDGLPMIDDVGYLTLSDEEQAESKASKKENKERKSKKSKGESSSKDKGSSKHKTGKCQDVVEDSPSLLDIDMLIRTLLSENMNEFA